jgi:hypothetical protein
LLSIFSLRIGAARKEAGSAFRFLHLQLPSEGQAVTRHSFQFRVDRPKLIAAELQDGHYLLRSHLVGEDPAVLWERYMQLAQIEAAFKAMKSELGIRPLYHQLGHRVEAHKWGTRRYLDMNRLAEASAAA